MSQELYNQPLITSPTEPDDADQLALGQPSVSGGKNITWARFKEIINGFISLFNSILFNTSYNPVSTVGGEVYWCGRFYTPKYDTGLGATVTIGNNVYDVFYNDTGAEIPSGKNLHLKAGFVFGGYLYPTFEYADPRDWQKVQGT